MRIRIEIEPDNEEEVIIRCKKITPEIQKIQNLISNQSNKMILYKDNKEFYIDLSSIIFFETDGLLVNAHTKDNVYQTKNKLYELEKLLPNNYIRISKSTIVNTKHIYSIYRNLTSSGVVAFNNTHKEVYVSRMYYKELKEKMEGKN